MVKRVKNTDISWKIFNFLGDNLFYGGICVATRVRRPFIALNFCRHVHGAPFFRKKIIFTLFYEFCSNIVVSLISHFWCNFSFICMQCVMTSKQAVR